MDKRHWIAAGLLASATAGVVYGMGEAEPASAAPAQAPAAPEVKVAEVVVRELARSVELTGAVRAVESVALRARVSGFVESVAFPEGGLVHAGQVLFRLDPRPSRVALERARAALRRADAQRELAELRLARGSKLLSNSIISESSHDALVADAQQARAATSAARAAVRAAELELSYTRVLSPITGRVGQSLVDAGNLVSGGTDGGTLLSEIVSAGPVHVEFDVDEPTYRRLLAAPRDAEGRVAGTEVAVGLAGDDGFPHAATLDFLANALDTSSGTARARATAANETGQLVPGLFARVLLAVDEPRPTVLISDRAVGTDQEGRYVLVVNDQGVVEQRHIRTDTAAFGLRIVASGLSAGERVVMGGMVRPGMQVRPRLVAMHGDNDSLAIRSVL
jgi:membrane fusion protein, gold/copper resistance efflux system